MKKRFASYLLLGKAASLPALAAIPPDYNDFTTTKLTLLEIPSGSVALSQGGPYGAGGGATVCVGGGIPEKMSVVVTGVRPGDTVWVLASQDKDDVNLQGLSQDLHIGLNGVTMASVFSHQQATALAQASVPGEQVSAVTVSIKLNDLAARGISLKAGSKFYMQAVIEPQGQSGGSGAAYWKALRYSELDEITISASGGSSSYGGYGCSAY
ncbi:hypothetical protein [Chitinimonas sp.]|uniref:hypothetical protein n=1 Tax=Chitinimonas sp. TaxID=1934313 RepID=UPI0035B18137